MTNRVYKLAALVILLALSGCVQAPSVTVDGEILTGKTIENSGVAAFLGVPFAEPELCALFGASARSAD